MIDNADAKIVYPELSEILPPPKKEEESGKAEVIKIMPDINGASYNINDIFKPFKKGDCHLL